MKSMILSVAAVATLAGSSFAAINDVNGYIVEARNFNDFGSSTLTINGTNYPTQSTGSIAGVGTTVNFNDQFPFPTVGNFANRHNAFLSADGGASRYAVQRNDSFFLQTRLTILSGSGVQKEGGLNFWNNRNVVDNVGQPNEAAVTFTDEGFFNVRSSDGEVAIFGGGLPFHSFGNVYVTGTTVTLGFAYYAPGTIAANAGVEYFYNGLASGIKFMDNVNDRIIANDVNSPTFGAGGISNFASVGFRAQNSRDFLANDFSDITYGETILIPTPGAAGLLGLAGLVAVRRRRA